MKETQPGTLVRMQPWTDSKQWKSATVVRHQHTPRSYVVQEEDGRKYRRNREHLRVCPASGYEGRGRRLLIFLLSSAAFIRGRRLIE